MKIPTSPTARTQRSSGGTPFVRNSGGMAAASNANLANSIIQAGNTLGSVGGLLSEQATQARRFGTLQNFSAFQSNVDEKLAELKRNADPAQGNFADTATAEYSNWEADWLKSVPDEFYDEFATRAADVKAGVARDALSFQYSSTDQFFRNGMDDRLQMSLMSLDQDGSLANLDQQRAVIDEYLQSSGLSEAEKLAIKRQAYIKIESVSYKSETRRGHLEAGAIGVGASAGGAVDLILSFDGSSMENGADYETNRELLSARVEEATGLAQASIGDTELWDALPDRAQSVLISLADDLGSVPDEVISAVATGNLEELANAVAGLGGERRAAEAQMLLGTKGMPEGQLDADERFANIPYEDRLALRADAEREANAQLTAENKAATAQQEAAINSLEVGLMDGNQGQWHIDQAREEGWLTKASDIKRLQTILDKQEEGIAGIQRMQQFLQNGQTINPANKDDRDAFDAWIGEEGETALRERNGDFVTQYLIPAVRSSGDLPISATGVLVGMTRSADPQQALFALDTLSQLKQASPDAYNARVSEQDRSNVEFWEGAKDYFPPDVVLKTVRGGDTQEERTRISMLRTEAKKLITDGSVNIDVEHLKDVLAPNGFLQFEDQYTAAGVTNLMERDYKSIFEQQYALDGNQEAAEMRTVKAMSGIWGETQVGGRRTLMRYPPAKVGYPTWNGSHDWMTEQGLEMLKGSDGFVDDGSVQNFDMIADEQTKAEVAAYTQGGPPPSYGIVYRDAQGNPRIPYVNGEMQRMNFEITPEMDALKLEQHKVGLAENDQANFLNMFNQAMRHSLETGIPIPRELQDEYNTRMHGQ